MGEKMNNELSKVQAMKRYSEKKQTLLDDIATAYISDSFNGLDASLIAIKSFRKALRMKGFSKYEIDEYLIQFSYITKTSIRKMFNESIYNEDNTIKYVVECIPFHTDNCTTDLIINELKNRPQLLDALNNNASREVIAITHKVKNSTLLVNFYNKYKDIIND